MWISENQRADRCKLNSIYSMTFVLLVYPQLLSFILTVLGYFRDIFKI